MSTNWGDDCGNKDVQTVQTTYIAFKTNQIVVGS